MSYNNDYDTAKTIEDKGKLSASNYFKQTVLLCRLWLQRQVSEDEIAERLRPMLDSVCVEYTDKMIDAVIHDALDIARVSHPLSRFQISFTKAEFDYIHSLQDPNMERIFFAFVCFRKMAGTPTFEATKTGLKNLASANWNQNTLTTTIQNLVQMNIISCKVRKNVLYYTLCDEFENLPQDKVVVMTATKKNIYYHYLNYIGIGNYLFCNQCGCIEKRKNSHQTLCLDCARKESVKNVRERVAAHRLKKCNASRIATKHI